MTVYGAFAPGSYNAWTLNLITDVFCTPGVARGGAVTAPGGMNVTLGVDAVAGDCVIVLPNGGYIRSDQAITFVVPSNGGSGTRTDAIVAFLDPTGVASPSYSLAYTTSWAGGFTGNNANQWVVALVSVAVGAASISGGNITQNPSVANFGNPSFVQSTNDQNGFLVNDSADKTYLVVGFNHSTQPTPNPRSVVLVAQNSAGAQFQFTHDYFGNLTIPGQFAATFPNGVTYQTFYSVNSTAGNRIFVQTTTPTNATNGDLWINARMRNPILSIFDRGQHLRRSSYSLRTWRQESLDLADEGLFGAGDVF